MAKKKMDNQQLSKCEDMEEVFLPVSDCTLYSISNKGNVKNNKTGKILTPRDLKGYARVSLYCNSKAIDKRIHRLVSTEFLGNPENKPEVNHKDGIRNNNCVDNLEWVTAKENTVHKVTVLGVGDTFKGSKNGNSKLSDVDILTIRSSTLSVKELRTIYKVTDTTIRRILSKQAWSHI